MLAEIRNKPNITIAELSEVCEISNTAVDKVLKVLKSLGIIQRIGANKNGHWQIKDP